MGVWLVSADVLAGGNPQPWERDWLARHGPAFRDRIKTDPFSAALAARRILLDAGLAERRRSGPHVLYRRTAMGDQLLSQPEPLADDHGYKRESSSAFFAANSSSVRTPR